MIDPAGLAVALKSVTLATGAALGWFVVKDLQAPGESIPWTLVSNGSSTLAVLLTVWFFVRYCTTLLSEARAERETKEKSHREEREAALNRMDTIVGAVKESTGRLEVAMRDLGGELRNNQRGPTVPPGG
jgi:membrane protein implicated in regulation of membrane protease activity